MTLQLSVPYNMAIGIPGAKADLKHGYTRSYVNAESSAEIPFGVVVAEGTNDGEAKLIAAATDKLAGFVQHSNAYDVRYELGTTGVKPKSMLNVGRQGTYYVQVEEAVSRGDIPWVRVGTGNGGTQAGAFRKSADGAAAEVHTVTPTAADSTLYVLRVELVSGKDFTFEYLSDASATATEIVTGFKALMAANAEFAALITASGTATLVLTATGNEVGQSFKVQSMGDGALADSASTPEGATAIKLWGSEYLTAAGSGGIAVVQVDFDAYRSWQSQQQA